MQVRRVCNGRQDRRHARWHKPRHEQVAGLPHDVARLRTVFHCHGPGGAALGVSGCEARGEHSISEFHFIAIVEHAIDFCRRVKRGWVAGVLKISFAA